MNPIGLLVAGGGVFAIAASILDWDFFYNHRKARFFVSIFGRNGARVFYGLLGTALVVVGALIATGILKDAR